MLCKTLALLCCRLWIPNHAINEGVTISKDKILGESGSNEKELQKLREEVSRTEGKWHSALLSRA